MAPLAFPTQPPSPTNPALPDSSVPVAVRLPPSLDIVAVAGGYGTGYALTSAGVVEAWGDDYDGQVGDDQAEQLARLVPGAVTVCGPGTSCAPERASLAFAGPESSTAFLFTGAAQSITLPSVADTTYGAAPIILHATATSGLPVTVTAVSDGIHALACSYHAGKVFITGAGTCGLEATQAGDTQYEPASTPPEYFTVAPAPVTLDAVDESGAVGRAPPPSAGPSPAS